MKAYSQDLRERVLRVVDQGRPRSEIISLFGVSRATIKRYLKQRRELGTLTPKPIPGRPSRKEAALQAGLSPQLQVHSDATLEEHCQLWEATHGMRISTATMSRAMARLGWTRKKRPEQQANATNKPEQPGESR